MTASFRIVFSAVVVESGIEFQGAAEKEVDTFGEIEEEEEEGGSKCCIDDNFLRWNVQYGPH